MHGCLTLYFFLSALDFHFTIPPYYFQPWCPSTASYYFTRSSFAITILLVGFPHIAWPRANMDRTSLRASTMTSLLGPAGESRIPRSSTSPPTNVYFDGTRLVRFTDSEEIPRPSASDMSRSLWASVLTGGHCTQSCMNVHLGSQVLAGNGLHWNCTSMYPLRLPTDTDQNHVHLFACLWKFYI